RGSRRSRRGVGSGELRELGDGVKKQDEVLKRLPPEGRCQRRQSPRRTGAAVRAQRAARRAPAGGGRAGARVEGCVEVACLGVRAYHESGREGAERARSERLVEGRYRSRCGVHDRLCLPMLGVWTCAPFGVRGESRPAGCGAGGTAMRPRARPPAPGPQPPPPPATSCSMCAPTRARNAPDVCVPLVIARKAASHVAVNSGVVATSGRLATRARPVSVETRARPTRAT